MKDNAESEENILYSVKCTETICYRDEQIEAKSIAEAKRKCHKMLVSKRLEIVNADSLYEIQEITETEFELTVSIIDIHEPIKIKAKDIEEAKEKCGDMLNKGSIDVVTTTIEIEDTTPKEIFQEENDD